MYVLVHEDFTTTKQRRTRLEIRIRVVLMCMFVLCGPRPAAAQFQIDPTLLKRGFTPVPVVSPLTIGKHKIAKQETELYIRHFCNALRTYFKNFKWVTDPCGKVKWQAELKSNNGHPLVYAVFGKGAETTLVLGGVHPDELTPVPIAFRFARYLAENPKHYHSQGIRVIVAPLVNPDGFLRNVPTRTNGKGVDLNRNFFTADWYDQAKKMWIARSRITRHFPGYFPNSEIETIFQMRLIDSFGPDKIMSIHAPLGFLDYDGPGDRKPTDLSKTEKRAKRLVQSISEKSQNYRVVDYSFFPGSLGNYAGNERKVPTVTLELETTNPRKVEQYWKKFLPGILQSIHYPFLSPENQVGNASRFSVDYML